ncbi:MAG: DUF2934 domain-containing protein [Methylobacter sp.]|jgi:hypothetical protein
MQAGFNPISPPHTVPIDPDKFREMVAERAYCKAEKRGFVPGHEMEDWLEAECEIRNQCFYWFQEVE